MSNRKMTNAAREKQAIMGTKTQRRKKYRQLVKEMGQRNISLKDIALGEKEKGFLQLIKDTELTMDEVLVLQQYSKAIVDRDTKAAEFIRDTAGEKPSTQIELSDDDNGLSKLSLEELREMKADLERLAKGIEKQDD